MTARRWLSRKLPRLSDMIWCQASASRRRQWVFIALWTIGFLLLALGLGWAAWHIYLAYTGEYANKLVHFLLQLGVIGVGTALVGLLVTWLSYVQAKMREKNSQRLDLLRRTRSAHVRVDHARRILRAERKSLETYAKQMQELMLVISDLEDIGGDVQAARRLFGPDNGRIEGGISGMVKILEKGCEEYVSFGASRPDGWLGKFVADDWEDDLSLGDGAASYGVAVSNSKGMMRFHVYGSAEPKINL